jgi:hypothetical protein
MNHQQQSQNTLEEIKVGVNLKIAAAWASFMFLYIYVDYFHLFMTGTLKEMLAGKVFVFQITPEFLLIALISVSIPALMIFLSVSLTAKINRWANVIIASMYIPYTLFNLIGEAWIHMFFGALVEIILLCIIIRLAWKWPHNLN